MNFNELNYNEFKQIIRTQIKHREFGNMTIIEWNAKNREIRNRLKDMNVKCRGCFYNPNDCQVYIKQSFRNERIDGLVQWTCSMEDYHTATGNEVKGFYLDDEWFAVYYTEFMI